MLKDGRQGRAGIVALDPVACYIPTCKRNRSLIRYVAFKELSIQIAFGRRKQGPFYVITGQKYYGH